MLETEASFGTLTPAEGLPPGRREFPPRHQSARPLRPGNTEDPRSPRARVPVWIPGSDFGDPMAVPRAPDHPGLPARVSVLRLPARGTVTRLLAPRDASAVCARFAACETAILRPVSGAGERRRSVIRADLRCANPTPRATRRSLQGHCKAIPFRAPSGGARMTARLPYTGNDDADAFLSDDPLALLIGFALDQQVSVQKAFSGPWELRGRLGHLDAAKIAATDPSELDRIFRERPAIHRFPGSMAGKVAALSAAIAERYDNDASKVWRNAKDGRDLEARLLELPGIGPMKAKSILAVLGKRYGVSLPGMAAVMPKHPTLGDVDSPEALAQYQAGKRAHKAEMRAKGERV